MKFKEIFTEFCFLADMNEKSLTTKRRAFWEEMLLQYNYPKDEMKDYDYKIVNALREQRKIIKYCKSIGKFEE